MEGIFDKDKWQEIFATIKKNKMRSALTALGVFWGVFMLVFLLGMGQGLENGVYKDFGGGAKNIMYVWPSPTTLPYKGFLAGRRITMKLSDLEVLRSRVAEIEMIAPRNEVGPFVIEYRGNNDEYRIRGELTDMPKIEALNIYQGRYINQGDVDEARKVVVLGKTIKEVLFGDDDAVGKHVNIKGIDFRVIGICGPEELKEWTRDDMESAVIPITTMSRAFGTGDQIGYFICSAKPGVQVSMMEPKVRSVLKELNNIHPDDPQGIGGFNLQERFQQVQALFLGIKLFLWFVGIGTLLAGIIGVSNIMLIIVKERTKEIGIRKALGATPKAIIGMILTESVFITSLSGYMGIIMGTILIGGINYLMVANNVDVENFYNPQVNLFVAIFALIVLVISGTVAGLIPAMQASKVNPVNALKDE